MSINLRKYIETMLMVIVTIAFLEFYVATYIWNGLYHISSLTYLFLGISITVGLLIDIRRDKKIALYYLLIIVCLLSAIINKSTLAAYIYYLKYYIFPISFAILAKKTGSAKLLKLIVFLYLLNVVLNIGWLLKINPLPDHYINNWADFAIGTIGSTYFAFLSIIFMVFYIINPKIIPLLVSSFGLIITNSLTLWGLSVPVFFISSGIKLKRIVSLLLIVLSAGLLFIVLFPKIYSNTIHRIGVFSDVHFVKEDLYTDMFMDYQNHPMKIVFGFGPGQKSSMASEAVSSMYYKNHIEPIKYKYDIPGGSVMNKYYSGVASIFWEIGLLGSVIYVYLIFLILFENKLSDKDVRMNLSFVLLLFLWMGVSDFFRNDYLGIITFVLIGILGNGLLPQFKALKINWIYNGTKHRNSYHLVR